MSVEAVVGGVDFGQDAVLFSLEIGEWDGAQEVGSHEPHSPNGYALNGPSQVVLRRATACLERRPERR